MLGQEQYIVTFEMSQSHLTLSISEHIKDAMNKATFDMPVDKRFYDSVKPGQRIVNDFRAGSFIMRGSFGNWSLTVKSKRISN